jgi:hypothetical protein
MYELDPNEARKADQTGNRISEIGKYVGTFTQAEDLTASSGTKGVGFRFEANGQTANLSLYTTKTDGTKLMGYQALMAIMTCMKLRGLTPKAGAVKFWNNDTKAEETRQGQVFPELCGKPIGLLLETEDYPKNSGGTGTRMVIAGIFQSDTELTASEILDRKTKPEQLAKMVARLRHRPARDAKAPATRAPAAAGGSGFDDMADDIPFRDPLARRGYHLVV